MTTALSRRLRPSAVIPAALLGITGLVFFVPFYWMLSSTLKPSAEIYKWPLHWIPLAPTFTNFVSAWETAPFAQFFLNSFIVTVMGTAGKLYLAITAAYAFAFLQFPGKKFLFLFTLGTLMVPGHITLLVNFLTVGNLGWINTYAGIIVPGLASAFGMFLLRQTFLSLPSEILEAAELDGAGHIRRLLSFVVPMTRPAIVTVALIAMIDAWNGFIWPLIVTNSLEMKTLPIGLLFLKNTEGGTDWGAIMAGATFVILPVLLLFLFAQRYIINGLAGATVRR